MLVCVRVVLYSWWTSFVSVVVYMCAWTQKHWWWVFFWIILYLYFLIQDLWVSQKLIAGQVSDSTDELRGSACLLPSQGCGDSHARPSWVFLWVLEFWIQALEVPQHLPSPRTAFLYPSLFSESGLSYWHQDWSKNRDTESHWLVLRQYWNCFPLRKEYWEIGGNPHHGPPRPNHPTPRRS